MPNEQSSEETKAGGLSPHDKFGNVPNVHVGFDTFISEYRSNQVATATSDRHRFIIEILALIAVALATTFAGFQSMWSRVSAEAANIAAVAAGNSVYQSQSANDLAKKNIELAQESFRMDHRAYVGVVSVSGPSGGQELVQSGKAPSFDCKIKNFGQSPALKIEALAGWSAFGKDQIFEPKYGPIPYKSQSVLFPTVEGGITAIHTPAIPINDIDIADLKSGNTLLYVYGKITYESFSQKRRTTFCFVLDRDLRHLNQCSNNYNSAD